MFNLVPAAVVPIVYLATRWIDAAAVAFGLAGLLAVVLYVLAYSAFARWARTVTDEPEAQA